MYTPTTVWPDVHEPCAVTCFVIEDRQETERTETRTLVTDENDDLIVISDSTVTTFGTPVVTNTETTDEVLASGNWDFIWEEVTTAETLISDTTAGGERTRVYETVYQEYDVNLERRLYLEFDISDVSVLGATHPITGASEFGAAKLRIDQARYYFEGHGPTGGLLRARVRGAVTDGTAPTNSAEFDTEYAALSANEQVFSFSGGFPTITNIDVQGWIDDTAGNKVAFFFYGQDSPDKEGMGFDAPFRLGFSWKSLITDTEMQTTGDWRDTLTRLGPGEYQSTNFSSTQGWQISYSLGANFTDYIGNSHKLEILDADDDSVLYEVTYEVVSVAGSEEVIGGFNTFKVQLRSTGTAGDILHCEWTAFGTDLSDGVYVGGSFGLGVAPDAILRIRGAVVELGAAFINASDTNYLEIDEGGVPSKYQYHPHWIDPELEGSVYAKFKWIPHNGADWIGHFDTYERQSLETKLEGSDPICLHTCPDVEPFTHLQWRMKSQSFGASTFSGTWDEYEHNACTTYLNSSAELVTFPFESETAKSTLEVYYHHPTCETYYSLCTLPTAPYPGAGQWVKVSGTPTLSSTPVPETFLGCTDSYIQMPGDYSPYFSVTDHEPEEIAYGYPSCSPVSRHWFTGASDPPGFSTLRQTQTQVTNQLWGQGTDTTFTIEHAVDVTIATSYLGSDQYEIDVTIALEHETYIIDGVAPNGNPVTNPVENIGFNPVPSADTVVDYSPSLPPNINIPSDCLPVTLDDYHECDIATLDLGTGAVSTITESSWCDYTLNYVTIPEYRGSTITCTDTETPIDISTCECGGLVASQQWVCSVTPSDPYDGIVPRETEEWTHLSTRRFGDSYANGAFSTLTFRWRKTISGPLDSENLPDVTFTSADLYYKERDLIWFLSSVTWSQQTTPTVDGCGVNVSPIGSAHHVSLAPEDIEFTIGDGP